MDEDVLTARLQKNAGREGGEPLPTVKQQGNKANSTPKRPAKGAAANKTRAQRPTPELMAIHRKTLRVYMERALALPPDEMTRERLAALGVPEGEQDMRLRLVLALLDKACGGDVSAFREVRDLMGEGGARAGAWQEQILALRQMFGEAADTASKKTRAAN